MARASAARLSPLCRDLTAMIVVFAILRVVAVAGLTPLVGPDSKTYLDVDFLGRAYRLWTVPLLYNVLPGNHLRVGGQVLLGVVAWASLAVAAARACRDGRVARVAAVAILALGLSTPVTQWDLAILSESATVSLTTLATALAIQLIQFFITRHYRTRHLHIFAHISIHAIFEHRHCFRIDRRN